MGTDYGVEMELAKLNTNLHQRYRNCVSVSQRMLTRYENYFPYFTDHTFLHTMNILDFCNQLIGEQLSLLSEDDMYVLMMGALFHDVGMGVSLSDFEEFCGELGIIVPKEQEERASVIRVNHQEFSGLFFKKYWKMFDVPNADYAHAIIQVCRGHRKTDLLDEKEYPRKYEVDTGKTVSLPYLAALICLADELDISANRNISFLYDVESMPFERDRKIFQGHIAIRGVELTEDEVLVRAVSEDEEIRQIVRETCDKLKEKLLLCRRVVEERSSFHIFQKDVVLQFVFK